MVRTRMWLGLGAVVAALVGCGGGGGRPDAAMDGGSPDAPSEAGWPDAGFDPGPDPEAPPERMGPSEDVTVRIDRYGVRHLEAADEQDLFYAAGYQMAADRLIQMDLMRRRALGRQAEVLGEDKFGEDRLVRWLDLPRLGRLDWVRFRADAPAEAALVEAWTAGVNRFVGEVLRGERPMPYGFGSEAPDPAPEPWRPSEVLAIVKLILFANQNQLEKELLASVLERVDPDLLSSGIVVRPHFETFSVPPEERPVAGRLETPPRVSSSEIRLDPAALRVVDRFLRDARVLDFGGSNNWAVAARHTANGRPLLAGDPHTTVASPNPLFVQHLRTRDGRFDVAGFSFVGAPMIHFGHNRSVAWSLTNAFPDTMDLWHVGQEDGGRYVTTAVGRFPVHRRVETIRVRRYGDDGRPMSAWDEEEVVLREVPGLDGVLLENFILPTSLFAPPGRAVLFRWVGRRATNESAAFFGMNRAASLDDFFEAVKPATLLGFGIMAADATSIGFHVAAKVPDRGGPSERGIPWQLLDGDDARTWWGGDFLPWERMPGSRDPARGFLLTANNAPFGFVANGRTDDDPWYYGALFAPGYRAYRIESELARLTGRGDVTVEDMQALQTDVTSMLAEALVPRLVEAWSRVESKPELAPYRDRSDLGQLVAALQAWDRRMTRSQGEPVAFHALVQFLTARVLADDFSFLFDRVLVSAGPFLVKMAVLPILEGSGPAADAVLDGEDPDAALLASLAQVADWLQERFGTVDPSGYRWGDVHGYRFDGPFPGSRLDVGFVSADGGIETVTPAELSSFFDGSGVAERFEALKGALFRMVVGFDADGVPQAQVSWIVGNSAGPDDAHFRDRLEDWIEGQYVPLPFRSDDVATATERTLLIEPGGGS